MLTVDQVQGIANDILTGTLKPVGFLRAEVSAGRDDIGEPAFFVRARFGPGAGPTPGKLSSKALSDLRSSLLEKGEDRFPYIEFSFADDVAEASGTRDADATSSQ